MSRTKFFFLASPQNLPPVVTSVTRVTPHVGINLQISLSFSKSWTRGFNILDNYWKWVENVVSLQREEWSNTASTMTRHRQANKNPYSTPAFHIWGKGPNPPFCIVIDIFPNLFWFMLYLSIYMPKTPSNPHFFLWTFASYKKMMYLSTANHNYIG